MTNRERAQRIYQIVLEGHAKAACRGKKHTTKTPRQQGKAAR